MIAAEASDLTHEPSRLAVWTEFHRQVADLPEEDREVFDLLWYQGLTQAEAAAVLGISERTVSRRWISARLEGQRPSQRSSPRDDLPMGKGDRRRCRLQMPKTS